MYTKKEQALAISCVFFDFRVFIPLCFCRNKAIVIRESHNQGDRLNYVTKLSLGETR
jgi:hypothetical protein